MSTPTTSTPGFPPLPPLPPAQGSNTPAPAPIQVHEVSSDGLWGAITGQDYMSLPPNTVGRTKTGDTPQKAMKNTWDPANTAPIGPGSLGKYVKVRLGDLPGHAPPPIKINISTQNYGSRVGDGPGKIKSRHIPEYPHTCNLCGGKMLWLFTSQEHEGGKECPAIVKAREAEERGDTRYKFKRKVKP